ncbi:MAG: replication initiation protein, partial [Firmicutes bacterium]|nr:replication initiation protein [Bacillota bacterium]
MQEYELLENLSLQKSNSLVSAKYKSSLIENQIMAIALTRIEVNATDEHSAIDAKLYPGELKRLIGDPTNIYKTLKKVAKTMTGHTMFLEDGRGNFKAFAVVNNADYIDGVFTVEFNKNLRRHILGLEKNYTTLELSVLTGFKRNSSFRIYELLKSHLYKSRKEINGGRVDVEYNISELRFMIGLANGDDPTVKNAMAAMGSHIDWDLLYSKLDKKDRKYDSWFDFQRYVIKPAQDELSEKSNIRFEYEGRRIGRKMGRISFSIYPNTPSDPMVIDERKQLLDYNATKNRQLEIPQDMYPELYDEFVGHNRLSREDISLLLLKAGGNAEKVRSAIELADRQPEIKNYMGWLIRCLENGYDRVDTLYGSAERAEQIREIRDEYERSKDETRLRVWKRIKTKEDYPDFLAMLEENGVTQDVLE